MMIDAALFRWKMTYRKYKKLLQAKSEWEQWTQGELPDAVHAAALDVTAQWLHLVDHPEMAKLLELERDTLVERVRAPMQIRLRKPKRKSTDTPYADDDHPDSPARTDRAALLAVG